LATRQLSETIRADRGNALHDPIITLGCFSLSATEFNLSVFVFFYPARWKTLGSFKGKDVAFSGQG
jgi:hypothetical protein